MQLPFYEIIQSKSTPVEASLSLSLSVCVCACVYSYTEGISEVIGSLSLDQEARGG